MITDNLKFINTSNTFSDNYTPLFFRLNQTEDRNIFNDFFSKIAHPVTVYDQIDIQLQELIKIKSPSEKKTKKQIQEAVKTHLNHTIKEEYGVWVYYPWSNILVHILDEEEFIELRTNRNLYKITREERDKLAQKKIGVVGMSVGQSIAIALAMERGCGELRLADFDHLELSNLNRIKTGIENLGISKAVIAAREIARLDPFIKVNCYLDGITEDNIEDFLLSGGKIDLLIEECDSLDIKILCRQKAREHKIPVLMDTNDRGMIDIERFDLEPNRPLLHGMVDEINVARLKTLSPQERLSFVMSLLDEKNVSESLKSSMKEIGKTITTWPQLASSVILGAALAADTSRRILLNQFNKSGRYFVDLKEIIY